MPHSVREQVDTQNLNQRLVVIPNRRVIAKRLSHARSADQPDPPPPPPVPARNADQQQPLMLKAWSNELDPRNLTINEALFSSGLTG